MARPQRNSAMRHTPVVRTLVTLLFLQALLSCSGGSNSIAQTYTGLSDDEDISNETMERADKIVQAWVQWIDEHDPSLASLSVSYRGRLISSHSVGQPPESPAPVASLTKAITGVCIARLVDNGKLSFDTRVQSVIPELASTATVASLLTHTTGLRVDITQNPAAYPGVDQEYLMWVSQQELSTAGNNTEASSYHYNNANYAILGALITRITGNNYEQACNKLVLEPAGIVNATLNDDWRIMSSWGGWKLSSIDYQKFLSKYFTETGLMNKDPLELPHTQLTDKINYGMGCLFRRVSNGGYNFWHSGQWHINYGGKRHRFSAFFAHWDNGWSVATNQNISAIHGELTALDSALATAAHKP